MNLSSIVVKNIKIPKILSKVFNIPSCHYANESSDGNIISK